MNNQFTKCDYCPKEAGYPERKLCQDHESLIKSKLRRISQIKNIVLQYESLGLIKIAQGYQEVSNIAELKEERVRLSKELEPYQNKLSWFY